MDYEKKYKEALERAKKLKETCDSQAVVGWREYLLPELAESEDEKTERILHSISSKMSLHLRDIFTEEEFQYFDTWSNDWLEKQGEQKFSYTTTVETGNGGINALVTRELSTNGCGDEQNPADKVEPKFKVGDWVIDKQGIVHQIANVIENVTYHTYGYDIVGGGYFNDNTEGVRLWTIQDAKDGDVLYSPCLELLWIFKNRDSVYCGCNLNYNDGAFCGEGYFERPTDAIPATKEQRDLLFQKMREAGYEWDAEKKELKKIEQKPTDNDMKEALRTEYEKGRADAIAEMQKDWSKEDEEIIKNIISVLDWDGATGKKENPYQEEIDWLYSLKNRVQPKQEWSEENEMMLDEIIDFFENGTVRLQHDLSLYAFWLKSLKDRCTWKPSDEQLEVLLGEANAWTKGCPKQKILESLYNDLNKLKA